MTADGGKHLSEGAQEASGGHKQAQGTATSLARGLLSVSSLTFLSRILGLARDVVIAATFAVGLHTDAFFVAFKIPNTLRRLTAEGAFTQSFVPVYNEQRRKEGEDSAAGLRDTMASCLALALVAMTVVGVVAAPLLVALIAPGFSGVEGKQELASDLLAITFPYILLISLTAFGGAILNSFGKFAAFAFVPALLNVSLIAAALLFANRFERPIEALAWGVVAGGVLQLAWQGTALWRFGQLPRFARPRLTPKVKKVASLTAQGAIGVSVAQLGIFISLVFASFLEQGSVTWLYFADRMMELPAGIIGAALATVTLPALSWHASHDDRESFSRTMDWSLRMALLIGVPAAAGLAMLSLPLAATIFQHGSYTPHDSEQTAIAIMAYSVGVPALVASRSLAAGFFSRQEPMVAVKVSIACLALTVALNFALVPLLRHAGLALALSIGATANALTLAALLLRRKIYLPQPGWNMFIFRVSLAVAAMALLLYWMRADIMAWTTLGALDRLYRLVACVAAGGAAYFAVLAVAGWRPGELRSPGGKEPVSAK